MKKTITLLMVLLSATLLFAKPYTQQGIAYLYDYKTKTKNPVANVSLTVAYAKGPAVSRADGTFTIEFQDFGAGKKLAFEKQPFSLGLMVLNKKEVDEWSTFEGKLTLIMCKKKDFDACKQNYYDVGLQSVTKRYERKIATLRQESADYHQRLQALEEERDRIMDNLRNSADAMARIDQSELDTAMQEVLDLYEQGNVEEAMKKLEDMKLEEKFIQTLDKKHEGERIVTEAIEDSVLMLKKLRTSVDMYKNSGNWDKAAETLKLLADKLNSRNEIYDYANFCRNQNNFMDAEIYYGKALEICQRLARDNPKTYESDVATTLNNLAILYSQNHRFTEAEEMFEQALEIYQRIAKDNPEAYVLYVAHTLNNLAILYYKSQRFAEAEEIHKLVLEARQQLARDNPKAYEPDVAYSLNNLANLYSNTQRLTEAEDMYKQALEIYKRIAKDNPNAYEPYEALTLNNLANLYSNTQRLTEAEEIYKQSLEIRQRIAQDNPKAYEPDVAQSLNNLANLYSNAQRLTEAEELYKQALEIRQRIAQDNPKAYEPDAAQSLSDLANLYSNTQQLTEAENMYKQALEIYKRIAKDNPNAYEPYEALILNNLANLYSNTQRLTEAEEIYKQALEIRQRIAQDNPKAYEPDVAQSLNNLANLYSNAQRLTEAEELYKQALEIRQRIAQDNPKAYEPDAAQSLSDLANLYSNTQRLTEAEEMYKQALEIRQRIAQDNPKAYEPDVAQTQFNMGLLYFNKERYTDAISSFEDALKIYRDLAKDDSSKQQRFFSSLIYLCQLYAHTNNYIRRYDIYQELLPLMKELYEKDKEDMRSVYASLLGDQSFHAIFRQKFSEAEQLACEGLAVDSTNYLINTNLAAALLFQGRYAVAEKIYRQYKPVLKDSFLNDFEHFKVAGVIPKEREEDVERIKKVLNEG